MDTPLLANAIGAEIGMMPGFAMMGPIMGLPVSVLAAFVERPLVQRAGVTKHALWFSLQANFVSLLAGYAALLIAGPTLFHDTSGAVALWPFVAIFISIVVERTYLALINRPQFVRWNWIIAANLCSVGACFGVLVLEATITYHFEGLRYSAESIEIPLTMFATVSCLLVFLFAFIMPIVRFPRADEATGSSQITKD